MRRGNFYFGRRHFISLIMGHNLRSPKKKFLYCLMKYSIVREIKCSKFLWPFSCRTYLLTYLSVRHVIMNNRKQPEDEDEKNKKKKIVH